MIFKNDLRLKKENRLSLFLHNDPLEMKGSKTIEDRRNLLSKLDKIYCVSEYVKKRFLKGIIDHLNKVVVLYNGVIRKKSFTQFGIYKCSKAVRKK